MLSCPSCGEENQGDHQFCVSCGARLPSGGSGVDRYRLEGVLGRGASSVVYRATDTATGNTVAVKALNPELVTRPGQRERLREEARILGGLSHPNIVAVVDFIASAEAVWLVTEFVEGTSLRNVLINAGRLEPEQALFIFTGLLDGLAYAHARGLVHGDLKPENVLVQASGTAKLVDFGQAVPAGHATVGGTANYMSPEAVRGESITPAADLYSVGAVLYEALTGGPPFLAASEQAVLRMHLTETPAPIGDVPEAIRSLVASMLEKDPARRPPSAAAALSSLETAVRDAFGSEWRRRAGVAALVQTAASRASTIPSSPPPVPAPTGPEPLPLAQRPDHGSELPTQTRRRHRLLAPIAAVLAVVAAAGLVVGLLAANSGAKQNGAAGGPSSQTPTLASSGVPTSASVPRPGLKSAPARSTGPRSTPAPSPSATSASTPSVTPKPKHTRTSASPSASPSSSEAGSPMVISQNTELTADVSCSNLTIEPGVTLTTNGYNIYCSGTVDNEGTIVTGSSAAQNFPLSYGGSGGGSTDLGGPAAAGFSTQSPGGAPCSTSGCTAGNGSSPPLPTISAGVISTWYQAGMNQYLAGAGGGSSPVAQGGSGANGLFIEASDIIAGAIDCAGGDGQNQPGQSSAGGGGGGVVILAYVSSLTPGNYAVDGGYTTTADGTHHEFGGNGAVVADQFSSLPVSVSTGF